MLLLLLVAAASGDRIDTRLRTLQATVDAIAHNASARPVHEKLVRAKGSGNPCSTSRFGAEGGTTACGGGDLETVSEALATIHHVNVPGYGSMPFFGVAPAQSMYQTSPDGSCGPCPAVSGSTAAASFDGVTHVGCGECLVRAPPAL